MSHCVFCHHENGTDCGLSDCRCMKCDRGHALDRDRADAARLRRRVSTLEGRLARVLQAERKKHIVVGEFGIRYITKGHAWSSRRTGGKR